MTATFECFRDDTGAYRFCLKAKDGEAVLWSTAFPTLDACKEAIASARRNCWIPERFEVDAAGRRRFQFTLKRANGQVLGRSRYYPSESICFNRLIHLGRAASGAAIMELTGTPAMVRAWRAGRSSASARQAENILEPL